MKKTQHFPEYSLADVNSTPLEPIEMDYNPNDIECCTCAVAFPWDGKCDCQCHIMEPDYYLG